MRRDARKTVAQGTSDGDGRIGEGRRGGEPVGRADVQTDECRRPGRAVADRAGDGSDKAEGGNEFGQGLRGSVAQPGGDLEHGRFEHEMCDPHAAHGSCELYQYVGNGGTR